MNRDLLEEFTAGILIYVGGAAHLHARPLVAANARACRWIYLGMSSRDDFRNPHTRRLPEGGWGPYVPWLSTHLPKGMTTMPFFALSSTIVAWICALPCTPTAEPHEWWMVESCAAARGTSAAGAAAAAAGGAAGGGGGEEEEP